MEKVVYVLIESDGWSRLVFSPPFNDGSIRRTTCSIAEDRRGDFALMEAENYVAKHGYRVEGPYWK